MSVIILSLQGGSQVPRDETHQLQLNLFLPHGAPPVLVGGPQRHNQRPQHHPSLSPLSNLSATHPPFLSASYQWPMEWLEHKDTSHSSSQLTPFNAPPHTLPFIHQFIQQILTFQGSMHRMCTGWQGER